LRSKMTILAHDLPLKRFDELNHTQERISLDWFGGIAPNLDEPDNPLIECVFSPVKESEVRPSNNLAAPLLVPAGQQFRAAIATGYLPTLFTGKLYRNGKAENTDTSMSREIIEFEFDSQDKNGITETTLFDLNFGTQSIPINKRYIETVAQSGIKILNGKIKKSDNKNIQNHINGTTKKIPLDVVIHEMEMIRYYLTNSEHSCKMLIIGAFSDENLFRQVINRDIDEPGFYPALNAHRLVYRHGYRKSDAPILGRILFEPDKLALRAAQRVNKTIARDTINFANSWVGYPRTDFPFNGVTRLTLAGRRIRINDTWYFRADRILDCTAPFPFKRLSFSDEIEKGGNPAGPDAPFAFANLDTIDKGPAHSGHNSGHSKSNQRPSATSESLHSTLGQRIYSGLVGVELIREKLRDSTYQSRVRRPRYVETLVDASTGRGTSGSSSAAKQKIEEEIVQVAKLTRSLSAFLSAIKQLKSKNVNWKIQTIGVSLTITEQDEVFSLFPDVVCDVHKRTRQFSYMDKRQKIRRRFMCVEVEIQGKYLYLFEAQRRPKDIAKDDDEFNHKETLPVLLLYRPGYESQSGNNFLAIIERTVKEKSWPSVSMDEFIRHQMPHCKTNSTVDDLSGRIKKFILRNCP
jgi:hypothetical protein